MCSQSESLSGQAIGDVSVPTLHHTAPASMRAEWVHSAMSLGDASVPTTHPRRSRPYASKPPGPWLVVELRDVYEIMPGVVP